MSAFNLQDNRLDRFGNHAGVHRSIDSGDGLDDFLDMLIVLTSLVNTWQRLPDILFINTAKVEGSEREEARQILSICPARQSRRDIGRILPTGERIVGTNLHVLAALAIAVVSAF